MADHPVTQPFPHTPPEGPAGRLESWKEIAAYLQRDVSTVQRWEKREGMPVHRHHHHKLGSVYAFRSELDAWWLSRKGQLDGSERSPVTAASAGAAVRATGRSSAVWATLSLLAVMAAALAWVFIEADSSWRNPLLNARFQQLTDFEGSERAAAVSRDGNLVAFLADRAGPVDVWVTQVGTGQFQNLTRGGARELNNPDVRTLGFSPDNELVAMWIRSSSASNPADIGIWAVPTRGGDRRPYLEGVAEFDWSADGTRLAYHTPGPGDPLFVKDHGSEPVRHVWVAPSGSHAHYPVWSPDGRFIYFVQGTLPDDLDIWRIAATGGTPERITSHSSRVTHPVFLDAQRLLYLATDADGTGPWLYGLDVDRREPHRLSFGVERYTSLSASADGRRLAVTLASQSGTLWRMPIVEDASGTPPARPITLPTARGRSPRYGPDYLLYVSVRQEREGIWKLTGDMATELWSATGSRIIGAPAVAPDGRRIAFAAEEQGRARLYTIEADGSRPRRLSDALEPRGAPEWTPDGEALIMPVDVNGEPRVVRVSLDGQTVVPLVSEYSTNPVWSPDGGWLLYSGPDVGTTFPVRAVRADGSPHAFKPLTLSRGARLRFLPYRHAIVVLRGEIDHKNFSLMDLDNSRERPLTNFGRDFIIRDFDVSRDGREIVFDQVQENSDIVLIDVD